MNSVLLAQRPFSDGHTHRQVFTHWTNAEDSLCFSCVVSQPMELLLLEFVLREALCIKMRWGVYGAHPEKLNMVALCERSRTFEAVPENRVVVGSDVDGRAKSCAEQFLAFGVGLNAIPALPFCFAHLAGVLSTTFHTTRVNRRIRGVAVHPVVVSLAEVSLSALLKDGVPPVIGSTSDVSGEFEHIRLVVPCLHSW